VHLGRRHAGLLPGRGAVRVWSRRRLGFARRTTRGVRALVLQPAERLCGRARRRKVAAALGAVRRGIPALFWQAFWAKTATRHPAAHVLILFADNLWTRGWCFRGAQADRTAGPSIAISTSSLRSSAFCPSSPARRPQTRTLWRPRRAGAGAGSPRVRNGSADVLAGTAGSSRVRTIVLIRVSGRAGTLNLHPDRLLVGLQTLRKGPKRRRGMEAFGFFFSRASIVRQQARRQSRSQRGGDEDLQLRLSTFGPRLAQTEGTGLRGAHALAGRPPPRRSRGHVFACQVPKNHASQLTTGAWSHQEVVVRQHQHALGSGPHGARNLGPRRGPRATAGGPPAKAVRQTRWNYASLAPTTSLPGFCGRALVLAKPIVQRGGHGAPLLPLGERRTIS
jgi:hypothetical protein